MDVPSIDTARFIHVEATERENEEKEVNEAGEQEARSCGIDETRLLVLRQVDNRLLDRRREGVIKKCPISKISIVPTSRYPPSSADPPPELASLVHSYMYS